MGIDYGYEIPLRGADGQPRYPDFTIIDAASGLTLYWEHLGMLTDAGYAARWERKLAWYRAMGVLPHEEGGGPNGVLVTTRDDEHGGIDSAAIEQLIRQVLGA